MNPLSDLMRWSLTGARVLVTGGSRGIGRAIVEEFLSHGALVVSVDLCQAEPLPNLMQIESDISGAAGRLRAIEALPDDWTAIDVLVNNAGQNLRKPTAEYSLEEYESILALNATAPWDLCRLLHSRLRAAGQTRLGGASIVNISSIAGLQSVGSSSAYATSKAAIAHQARYLAVEWAKDKIRVNAVAPGWTRTPLTEKIQASVSATRAIEERTPLGRLADASEIASVVVFLAMPAASYVSGAVIPVDGAMSAFSMDVTAALRG